MNFDIWEFLSYDAEGPCHVCGQDATGSPYFTGMSQENWEFFRPFVGALNVNDASFTPDVPPEERALNVFFGKQGMSKAFCSPQCSLEYHNGQANSQSRDRMS